MWECFKCPADAVNHCVSCDNDFCSKHMDDEDDWCENCWDVYADQ